MKIRGVPETILQAELRNFTTNMFKALISELNDMDVRIDKIHHLPKPKHLPDQLPRDVILLLHFYHVKERLMMTMRKKEQIPAQYSKINFYANLSQYTLKKHKNLNLITKVLRNHKIVYRWGYTTKITITKEGSTYVIESLERSIFLSWNILPDASCNSPSSSGGTKRMGPEWWLVTAKNSQKHN